MHPFDLEPVVYDVGDLVRFIGYHYSPDYYYPPTLQYEQDIGIIVEQVSSPITTNAWLYRVYWFKTKKMTETTAAHLTMAK